MSNSLTYKTVNGVKWSTAATITNSILQIGYTAIMARLLTPSAFGLVALSGVILRFGQYFANMGLVQSLIQKKDLNDDEIRAGFTSSIILGASFSLIVYLLAPLSVYFSDNPELIEIVRVMCFSFLITGFSNTSISLLRRNIRFKEIAIVEIVSYIVGYVFIGVGLAYFNFGVWSLVAASMSQALIAGIFSYILVRHNLLLSFNWNHYKALFAYGSKSSVTSFLEFIGHNMDTLLIGKLLGPARLGIYNRAFMLINLPVYYFTLSISKVLFPAFSKIQSDRKKMGKVYVSAISLVGFIVFPICMGICVSAKSIVAVLLGEKWMESVEIIRILAFAIPFSLITHFGGIICDATANLKVKIILQSTYVIFIGALFFLLQSFGLVGFAYVILIGLFLRNLGYMFVVKSIVNLQLKEILSAYLPGVLTSIGVGIVLGISIYFFELLDLPHLVILINQAIIGAVMLSLLLFMSPNKGIRLEIAEKLRNSTSPGTRGVKGKIISKSISILGGFQKA